MAIKLSRDIVTDCLSVYCGLDYPTNTTNRVTHGIRVDTLTSGKRNLATHVVSVLAAVPFCVVLKWEPTLTHLVSNRDKHRLVSFHG